LGVHDDEGDKHVMTAKQAAAWAKAALLPAVEAAVMVPVAAITLSTSADHVLTLGRAHGVSGWHSWSVAGVVEILAAYAALEYRRRDGWRERVLPAGVFAVAFAVMLAMNWAAAAVGIPAREAVDSWRRALFLMPPAAFIGLVLLVETRARVQRVRVKRVPARAVAATPKTVPAAQGRVSTPPARQDTPPVPSAPTPRPGVDTGVVDFAGHRVSVDAALAKVQSGAWTQAEAARRAGVSTKTIQRKKAKADRGAAEAVR
jgi:hypothetical protein